MTFSSCFVALPVTRTALWFMKQQCCTENAGITSFDLEGYLMSKELSYDIVEDSIGIPWGAG